MEAILIEPRNEKEMSIIKKILTRLGLTSETISENQLKLIAGAKAVEMAKNHPKYDLSDDDILNMVKEVEEEVYGKK
jgi:hypothetical protein